jgi:hypothetical protein
MSSSATAERTPDRAEQAAAMATALRKWARWSRNVVMQKTIIAAAEYLEREAERLAVKKK